MEDSKSDDVSGTAVETVEAPASAGTGPAPVSTPQDGGAGPQVEGSEEGRAPSQLPKWAYNIVRENRAFKRDLADLRERIAAQPRSPEGKDATPKDVWTDPDGWADAKISKQVQAEIQKAEVARKKVEAYEYVRSQKDVTPENEDEFEIRKEVSGHILWRKVSVYSN